MPEVKDIAPILIDEATLKDKIYVIRGQQVMLDFDLAEIYGYTTKAFNQQVQRNIEKFDDDFMFQLIEDEQIYIRSQNVTGSHRNERYLPYAFTEQGIYMLMTVLRGPLAIQQSKALIRLFKQMKDSLAHIAAFHEPSAILLLSEQTKENTQAIEKLDRSIGHTQNTLSAFMASFGQAPFAKEYVVHKGHALEADIAYQEIYGLAKKRMYVVDNYIGPKTLQHLRMAPPKTAITIFSDNLGKGLTTQELKDFRAEYPDISLELRTTNNTFHDRFIVLDYGLASERLFFSGVSSKDAGARTSFIYESSLPHLLHPLIDELLSNPPLEIP